MGNIKNIKGKAFRGSIKVRWISHILVLTVIALIIVMIVLLLSAKTRYDNAAELAIRARVSKSIDTFFDYYNDGSDETFSKGAAEYVANFQYKDTMEVWVLDKNGSFDFRGFYGDYEFEIICGDKKYTKTISTSKYRDNNITIEL